MMLDSYGSSALLTAVVILIITWLIVQWNKNRKLPPGPWGLPLFGYYPFISSKTHEHFAQLAKYYGKVFSFRTAGGTLVVVLNGAKIIKEILINRADEFDWRPNGSNLINWLSDGKGITQEDGTAWKEQRRFFLQTAKNLGFGKSETENLIEEEVRQMMVDLRKINGKPTNLQFHIAYAVSSVVTQILMSKKFDKHDPDFGNLLNGLNKISKAFQGNKNLLLGLAFDIVMRLSPSTTEGFKGKHLLKRITKRITDEHVKTFDKDQPKDYVDAFLKYREELRQNGKLDDSSFTMERLLANTMNLILEGTESVSLTIYSMAEELSNHPEIQEKAKKELDSVIGHERLPSWVDRPKLPYFEAVIQELYRHASPFIVTTQYSNYAETTIEGYKIPRRSIIVSNLWTIHMDPAVFPNPKKFDPNRFLNSEGKKIKFEGPYPFGLGKRSCVGESLAQIEVFLVLASLVQNSTILPGDSESTLRIVPRE